MSDILPALQEKGKARGFTLQYVLACAFLLHEITFRVYGSPKQRRRRRYMKFMVIRALSLTLALVALCVPRVQSQQGAQVKFVADTLIVEAEGTYESDPDQALLAFDVSVQGKELKQAYTKAAQAMRQIVEVAERNGLSKDAIQTGVLTVTPYYEGGGRNRKVRAYTVQGHVQLKVQDFSKVGPILDDSVQEGVVDFRSLTYSLANEEAAKQKAVADAMQRALGRATIALQQSKQKLGATRYVNLEVRNLVGVSEVENLPLPSVNVDSFGLFMPHKRTAPPPPAPPVRPGKIAITATVQCVFQIDR
jgi:uncharacterized protein